MSIAQLILQHYSTLNPAQKEVIGQTEGPLLAIAGPGSGKTLSLVLRAINLFLLEKAPPARVVLCTFTEKAAFELRDRIATAARTVGYRGDLSELRVSTIHGLCNRLLALHRHRTPLGNGFETLDELTQRLFVFDHFDEIIGEAANSSYLGRWSSRWGAIDHAAAYFDKITEELLDPSALSLDSDPFLVQLARAYLTYEARLLEQNRVDFSHLQKLAFNLLADEGLASSVQRGIDYLMVDEYQDTNYIQEQLLLKLAGRTGNLCVVGDEDQSLYRFRGATVRNILEFPTRVAGCQVVVLDTNYRSHRTIVSAYDRWMSSASWTNPAGPPFRYTKIIVPSQPETHPDYPAVFATWGTNATDEATRVADMVAFLMESQVIDDYSQVALLLHSVRQQHSAHYLAAFEAKGIPAFCPRARAYFDNDEVQAMVGCFALIFGYHGEGRGDTTGGATQALASYVDRCLVDLAKQRLHQRGLVNAIRQWAGEIDRLAPGEDLDLRPADYFYRLLALDPFATWVKNENRARNLATFSQLLNTFQAYYHFTVVSHANRIALRMNLFASFLRLLVDGGINEYEDPDQPIPRGYVQVMTIHQSKGLEFPVVIVGSLATQLASPKQVDRDLAPFYHRAPFEPEGRITHFDRMRLHYVAFSRAEKILVLTAHAQPKDHFGPIWQGLPQWPYVQKDLLAAQRFVARERTPIKRSYSFTGSLKVYETCPRQYQFFRDYDFTPSRSGAIFFGLLVHQTIEEVHRIVMDGGLAALTEGRVGEVFERTFAFLSLSDVRPIGEAAKAGALTQVLNYVRQNSDEMARVIETEVDVSVEKEGYILTGKIDLLLGGDGRLELLDFKTAPRPADNPELLAAYERQLAVYAYILETRHGKRPDRLLLYWTPEPDKRDALMELPYDPEAVGEAGRYFDEVVGRIQRQEFAVARPPGPATCKECDLRQLCVNDGIIAPMQTERRT